MSGKKPRDSLQEGKALLQHPRRLHDLRPLGIPSPLQAPFQASKMRIVTVAKKPYKRASRAKKPKTWQEAVRMALTKPGKNLREPGANRMWRKNMIVHFIKDNEPNESENN
jgi:hypothetical protein